LSQVSANTSTSLDGSVFASSPYIPPTSSTPIHIHLINPRKIYIETRHAVPHKRATPSASTPTPCVSIYIHGRHLHVNIYIYTHIHIHPHTLCTCLNQYSSPLDTVSGILPSLIHSRPLLIPTCVLLLFIILFPYYSPIYIQLVTAPFQPLFIVFISFRNCV
jgi:hypothetical protein